METILGMGFAQAHGKVAFSNSDINKKMCDKQFVKLHHSRLPWVNDTLWFHLPIVDYYIMQFEKKNCYKDKSRKAFFTMATLLMPLLWNDDCVTVTITGHIPDSVSDYLLLN